MAKIGMYRIPQEINTSNIHKRGAIAMAVQEQYYKDPSKYNLSSSPFSFYIVQKGPISDNYMDEIEKKYDFSLNAGDSIIFNEGGIHRGSKNLSSNRIVIRFMYSI